MKKRFESTVLLVVLAFLAPIAAADASLFQRLGGEPVLSQVAAETLRAVANDPEVNQSFDGINRNKLGPKLYVYLCWRTGGDCVYRGDDMRTVHAGQNITEREMVAMVEALRSSLDAHQVGEREKNELLRMLAPHKREIVTR